MEKSVVTTNQTHTAVENLKPESKYVSTGTVLLFPHLHSIHVQTLCAVISSECKEPNIRNHVSVTIFVAVVAFLDSVHVQLSYSYTG